MSPQSFSSEEALVSWLKTRASAIGDDAALLPPLGAHAITVDSQREGIHFRPGTPAAVIARRLLAVNLSDLAAVGARPHQVLCTLAAPAAFQKKSFFEALLEACRSSDVELVGGDLSSSRTIECSLTAIGVRRPRGRFLTRSAAEPGQCLWLSGNLGESHLGLELLQSGARARNSQEALDCTLPSLVPRHLRPFAQRCLRQHLAPTPQLAVGHYLAGRRCSIAAIDISDGLAKDITRLATASQVKIFISLRRLFTTTQTHTYEQLCQLLGTGARRTLLTGGEDYSLAFTIPESYHRQLERLALSLASTSRATSLPPTLTMIGKVTAGSAEVVIVDDRGSKVSGEAREYALSEYLEKQIRASPGWDHLDLSEAIGTSIDA